MLILLMIGKIIGIILLIAVVIIAVVLFVPMRYRLTAQSDQKQVDFVLRWLFGLVSFHAGYLETFDYGLRVAGIRVFPRDKGKKKQKKNSKKDDSDEAAGDDGKKKPSLKERVGKVVGVLKSFHEQGVAGALFPLLQTFLYRIRPRKVTGDVAFGFADPSTTGRVLGEISLIPFLFATDLEISPDFETDETYLDGSIRMRGHILIIHVLIFLIGLFRKREFRKFMHVIRKKNKKK